MFTHKSLLLAAFFAITASTAAQSAVITAYANGTDSARDVDFWGFSVSGRKDEFVASVSISLSPQIGAFFDFDGLGNFGGATGPVFGAMSGISASDISVTTSHFVGGNTTQPSRLTFSFKPRSFGDGDAFRFSAEAEFPGLAAASAGTIWQTGTDFRVRMEGGESGGRKFKWDGGTGGIAPLFIQTSQKIGQENPSAVPLPAPIMLLLGGLGALGLMRRRARRGQSTGRIAAA